MVFLDYVYCPLTSQEDWSKRANKMRHNLNVWINDGGQKTSREWRRFGVQRENITTTWAPDYSEKLKVMMLLMQWIEPPKWFGWTKCPFIIRKQSFLWKPKSGWLWISRASCTWMPSKLPLCQCSKVLPLFSPLPGHLYFWFLNDKMENMVAKSSRVCMPLFGHLSKDSTNSVPNFWWRIRVRLLATDEHTGWPHRMPVILWPCGWRDACGHLHSRQEPITPFDRWVFKSKDFLCAQLLS